ncbi:MAG TPA: sugar transporter [Firmicutes bacterium]|nr:sugar transporter [Bacillota bacterium]
MLQIFLAGGSMKHFAIVFLSLLILILSLGSLAQADDYDLGPGDAIDINVWGYDELQEKDLMVRPDGKIAFPLIGEITVEGLTPGTLAEKLTSGLNVYIQNPRVTVNLTQMRTVRAYVLGEVNKPGMYEIAKSHKVLDFLGMAGGFTHYAAKKTVYVVHKKDGRYEKINLNDLLKKGDLTQNVELDEGDVVYLASNGLDFIKDILPYITAAYEIKIISNN